MKLRKLSAAIIASTVLVMPLSSYMTASAEDAPIVFSTFNISGVTEGSAASPTFTPESDIEVFSIMTYHWNHGSGSPAGTISIYDGEELIGTWEAVGSKGMYNTPDANWTCYPRGLVLKAGHTYKFSDSDPNTWSYNSGSEGCGFVEIRTGTGSTVGVTPSDSQKGEEKVFNSHTYQRFDAPASWDEAKAYCEAHGGHLVTITSEGEQKFIESVISDGKMDVYWLGGTAYDCTLEWVTGEDTSYTNWAEGQPDNAFEGYHVEIQKTEMDSLPPYTWGDTDAAGEFFGLDRTGFVCEWDEAEAHEGVPVTAEIVVGNWEIYKAVDESTGEEVEREFKGWKYTFKSDGTISSDNEDTENITWQIVDGKMVCSSEVVLDYDGTDLIEHLEGCSYYFRKIGDINALGDLNSDGKIDAKDASMILVEYSRMSTGEESTLTDAQKSAANVNGDDKIDAKDASTILSYYAMASTATGDVPTLKEFAKPKES